MINKVAIAVRRTQNFDEMYHFFSVKFQLLLILVRRNDIPLNLNTLINKKRTAIRILFAHLGPNDVCITLNRKLLIVMRCLEASYYDQ